MKGQFLKTFGLLCLSALLAYAGVSWAFENCLNDGEKGTHEHSAIANFESHKPLNSNARSPNERVGEVHCLTTHHRFDAIAQTTSIASLFQLRKSVQVKRFALGRFPSNSAIDIFRAHPLRGWFISTLPPGQLSRHLLLSVFLI